MASRGRNWEAVRAAYLAQPVVDFGALARDFGIPAGTIKNRASKGNWSDDRDPIVTAVRENVTERIAADLGDATAARIAEHGRLSALFLARHEALLPTCDTPGKLKVLQESFGLALDADRKIHRIADLAPADGKGALDADADDSRPRRLVIVDPGDPRAGIPPEPDADG